MATKTTPQSVVSINPEFVTPQRVLVKNPPSSVIGADVAEFEERLPEAAAFAGFFLVDGAPASAEQALAAIEAGARFDSAKAAHTAIENLIDAVGLPVAHSHLQRHHASEDARWSKNDVVAAPTETQDKYRAPLAAHHKAVHAERESRALEKVGLKRDDDLAAMGVPTFFTAADLAQIYGVTEATIYNWEREAQVIPRALRLGGVLRWPANGVLALLNKQAGS